MQKYSPGMPFMWRRYFISTRWLISIRIILMKWFGNGNARMITWCMAGERRSAMHGWWQSQLPDGNSRREPADDSATRESVRNAVVECGWIHKECLRRCYRCYRRLRNDPGRCCCYYSPDRWTTIRWSIGYRVSPAFLQSRHQKYKRNTIETRRKKTATIKCHNLFLVWLWNKRRRWTHFVTVN